MNDRFDQLARSFVITSGGNPLPGASAQINLGAVAVVAPNERSGNAFIEHISQDLPDKVLDLVPVGDPWEFMRRACLEGICAIQEASDEPHPSLFMFMVRVDEAASTLPTVLAIRTDSDPFTCLTRTRIHSFDHSELLHWERFDILDRISGTWGARHPFRNWRDGDPLYELAADEITVLIANVPLLGHWKSPQGALAFFTTAEEAAHYHHHRLGDGVNRMLVGPTGPEDAQTAIESLTPQAVSDLNGRLRDLAENFSRTAWCVNPSGHRENSAYGWLMTGSHPNMAPQMRTVAGIWDVRPGNVFEKVEKVSTWSGSDTILWSGGQRLRLAPLDRSFVGRAGASLDGMTATEEEEMVAARLERVALETSQQRIDEADVRVGDRPSQFHIVSWDVVQGYGDRPHVWRFPDVMSAVDHLAAYEREHDRRYRIEGAASPDHIGFSGSRSREDEERTGVGFQLGLQRIALRALRDRYRPADADELVHLCNRVLATRHVDVAGFAADLLWASGEEQQGSLLSVLGIDEDQWLAWKASARVEVDPIGAQLVTARLGQLAWDRLLPETQHFLATALLHLQEQGHAPQLDYAPISMEVVKALEVELGRIFQGFRDVVGGQTFQHDDTNSHEGSLARFLNGGKSPTLGAISYLFRLRGGAGSPLTRALCDYLARLPNGDFLTSRKFAKEGIQRVIHKYRNGGVHDASISDAHCRECVDFLIGDETHVGLIVQVSSWRP